ncbi:MAG: molybdopterin molybdotransferase MoeA [Burkholderiales bacterium]|nr:molybdopterin molybdotransferase MoeA [Burkholderiales bacterium]
MTVISPLEALDLLISRASPVAQIERAETESALGRILAEELLSPCDVPPCDNSAMDGFAISVEGCGEEPLPISQRIPAGIRPLPLAPGTAARIFTGAPIPLGADAVVMQEDCIFDEEKVKIGRKPKLRSNIRRRGEDIAKGSVFLHGGMKLRPQELALISSVGIASIRLYRKLRVAIFFTGNEIVMPGTPLGPGQIYNSNRFSLIGLLDALHCEIHDLGIVPDDVESTVSALEEACRNADLVLTCGGVSVGEEDHVRVAVEKIGCIEMWGVAIKPGKPFAFGEVFGIPFIGLPGNPVSAFQMFCLFARPFILRSQGALKWQPQAFMVKADFDWEAGKRAEWLRAKLDGESRARIYSSQGSAMLTSLVWADGLVEVPPGVCVQRGEMVRFTPFSELFI